MKQLAVQAARLARERLSRCMIALQDAGALPAEIANATGEIATALGDLFRAETGTRREALDAMSRAAERLHLVLGGLQRSEWSHTALDLSTGATARALAILYPAMQELAYSLSNQPSSFPQAMGAGDRAPVRRKKGKRVATPAHQLNPSADARQVVSDPAPAAARKTAEHTPPRVSEATIVGSPLGHMARAAGLGAAPSDELAHEIRRRSEEAPLQSTVPEAHGLFRASERVPVHVLSRPPHAPHPQEVPEVALEEPILLGRPRANDEGEPIPLGRPRQSKPALHGAERRTSPRMEIETDIGFYSDTNFYTGFTGDISDGGIFIATWNLLPVGTTLTVSFVLPGGHQVLAEGRVTWVRDTDTPELGVHPGMGVFFERLSGPDRQAIQTFIEQRSPLFFDDDQDDAR